MGLDIGIELLTLIMFGSLPALLMAGLPPAFVTGGLACVFPFIFGNERVLNIVPSRIFPLMTNCQLSAIPLFIFMAAMLERGGIINEMLVVVLCVNMQMSFLSPPFGYALFYLRVVAPPKIPMVDIFTSALPFVALQIVGLTLCMLFPQIIARLPRLVYG